MGQQQCDTPEAAGRREPLESSQKEIDHEFPSIARQNVELESPIYPTGMRLVFIFVALCLTVFLVALVRNQISVPCQDCP